MEDTLVAGRGGQGAEEGSGSLGLAEGVQHSGQVSGVRGDEFDVRLEVLAEGGNGEVVTDVLAVTHPLSLVPVVATRHQVLHVVVNDREGVVGRSDGVQVVGTSEVTRGDELGDQVDVLDEVNVEEKESVQGVLDNVTAELLREEDGLGSRVQVLVVVEVANGTVESGISGLEKVLQLCEILADLFPDLTDFVVEDAFGEQFAVGDLFDDVTLDGAGEVLDFHQLLDETVVSADDLAVVVDDGLVLAAVDEVGEQDLLVLFEATRAGDARAHLQLLNDWDVHSGETVGLDDVPVAAVV